MSVSIKSERDIEHMKEAGRILAIVHEEMEKIIRPGISTYDINKRGEEVIRSYGCIPSFLNYQGYPASICVSVNDEVVHGKKSLLDKMPGDCWQKFAGLRLLYSYYMLHPGKKLLFMGGEFGQGLEWRYDYGLEWQLLDVEPHAKTQKFVKELNHLYKKEKT